MNAKIIEHIPFPSIVTSNSHIILHSNEVVLKFTKRIGVQTMKVSEVFDVWEELEGGKLIHATSNGSSCIFMKTKLEILLTISILEPFPLG